MGEGLFKGLIKFLDTCCILAFSMLAKVFITSSFYEVEGYSMGLGNNLKFLHGGLFEGVNLRIYGTSIILQHSTIQGPLISPNVPQRKEADCIDMAVE